MPLLFLNPPHQCFTPSLHQYCFWQVTNDLLIQMLNPIYNFLSSSYLVTTWHTHSLSLRYFLPWLPHSFHWVPPSSVVAAVQAPLLASPRFPCHSAVSLTTQFLTFLLAPGWFYSGPRLDGLPVVSRFIYYLIISEVVFLVWIQDLYPAACPFKCLTIETSKLKPKLNQLIVHWKSACPKVFSISINDNAICLVIWAKKFSVILISVFLLPSIPNTSNPLVDAFITSLCLCWHHPGQATVISPLDGGTCAWIRESLCCCP